jgi:hypothetical protein
MSDYIHLQENNAGIGRLERTYFSKVVQNDPSDRFGL